MPGYLQMSGGGNILDDDMAAASKLDVDREGTPSSIGSTPDDAGPEASQEPTQPQKRKGGRKPIYATSEERKQRNRQAQAAFRERRTEYIKQLEATIKQNEDSLSTLQQSHRTAADECLMLRYKNSLLERILLEKGIDVQAELQIKTGSPVMGGGFSVPGGQATQPPLQRTAIQRQHARRSAGQNYLPKLAPGQSNPDMGFPTASPQGVPTPSSHASSPTNMHMRSPMTMHQGGTTPPTSAAHAQPQQQQQFHNNPRSSQAQPNQAFFAAPQQSPRAQRRQAPVQNPGHASTNSGNQFSMNTPMSTGGSMNAGPSMTGYYPSPFQKHIDQLEQEYDTEQPRSMLDHPEQESTSDPSPNQMQGSYAQQFDQQHNSQSNEYYQSQMSGRAQQPTPTQNHFPQGHLMGTSQGPEGMGENFQTMGQVIDPNDPILDADPFGLSASMHYPTSYSVMEGQQSHPR